MDTCIHPKAQDCYYRFGEFCNWWNKQIRLAGDKEHPCREGAK